MATETKLLSFFALFSLIYLASAEYEFSVKCNVPSKFWCDTEEIALNCGVYQQCEKLQWTVRQNAKPVDFTLYYESLCPDCKEFITQMLYPTFKKIGYIMNLTLIPYGNAREEKVGDHWEFECQHGKQECEGNIIETCAIAIIQDINKYLPFIYCMESSRRLPKEAAKQCASQATIPLEDIMNCTTSSMGNKLEHEMAVKTDALKPSHNYVPWVTLNGVHTEKIQEEAQDNLLKLICDTYKGPKPSQCSQGQQWDKHSWA